MADSRAAVQFLRQPDGGWLPVGVWLGTITTLQSRFLPDAGMDDFARRIHEYARPPRLDNGTIGSFCDWIGWALDGLSNGHDLFVVGVQPEMTVDDLYAREVLKMSPTQAKRQGRLKGVPSVTTLEEMPPLEGRAARGTA